MTTKHILLNYETKKNLNFILKLLVILCLSFSSKAFSQEINGTYRSNLTLFRSEENPEKNFTKSTDDIISVEIYDAPYTRGYVSVSSKNNNGEVATIKFIVKNDKTYKYENGETFLCYEGVISLLDIESKRKCTIAFDVKVKSLIIMYDGGGTQLWDLKKI